MRRHILDFVKLIPAEQHAQNADNQPESQNLRTGHRPAENIVTHVQRRDFEVDFGRLRPARPHGQCRRQRRRKSRQFLNVKHVISLFIGINEQPGRKKGPPPAAAPSLAAHF